MTRWCVVAVLLFALFALPAAAEDVPLDAIIDVLPFEPTRERNRIQLDLAPAGARPFRMMLDTGASFSVLTPLAARALGVSIRRMKQDPYVRSTRLGRSLQFYVDTRSSATGSKTGWEYGLLGGNFLEHYVVELDFANARVRFLDPERFEVPEQPAGPDEAVVPIRLGTRRPTLEVEIDGRPLRVLLDTGAPWGLLLSGAAARKVGIDEEALPEAGTFQTTLGPMFVRLHEIETLAIGGLRVGPAPVFVSPRGWYNLAGEANDSVIGYDVLSSFLVRIDYPRKRVWLRRQRQGATLSGLPYEPMRASGAIVAATATPGVVHVIGVHADSPAARRGLRRGDALLPARSDGESATPMELLAALRDDEPLRVLRPEGEIDAILDLPRAGTASEAEAVDE